MPPSTLSDSIHQVDLAPHLSSQAPDQPACTQIANSLRHFGAVLVRDPRVSPRDESRFIDLMERYFAQPRPQKLPDARPHLFYQVGVTPDKVERPRDNSSIAAKLDPAERPVSDPAARHKDPKWRFFWRCGERPQSTHFPELNAAQVVPKAFEDEWAPTMDSWGAKLLHTITTVAEMLAIGLGLSPSSIRDKLEYGPHLLAPTGVDMDLFADKVGTTIAGYHYDLNVMTIHGRARYPGLFIWTRTGKRIPVAVPEGYLLIQSGIQLEYLTGGEILRGMHEVVVSKETSATAKRIKENGGVMWRVSSTLFAHIRSDASLKPLEHFAHSPTAGAYPDIKAGEQVAQELKTLELAT